MDGTFLGFFEGVLKDHFKLKTTCTSRATTAVTALYAFGAYLATSTDFQVWAHLLHISFAAYFLLSTFSEALRTWDVKLGSIPLKNDPIAPEALTSGPEELRCSGAR